MLHYGKGQYSGGSHDGKIQNPPWFNAARHVSFWFGGTCCSFLKFTFLEETATMNTGSEAGKLPGFHWVPPIPPILASPFSLSKGGDKLCPDLSPRI